MPHKIPEKTLDTATLWIALGRRQANDQISTRQYQKPPEPYKDIQRYLLSHVSASFDTQPVLETEVPVWLEVVEVLDELQQVIQGKGIRTSLVDAVQILTEASELVDDEATESILIGYVPSTENLTALGGLAIVPRLQPSPYVVEEKRRIKRLFSLADANVSTQRPDDGATRSPNERVGKADAQVPSTMNICHELRPQCLVPRAEQDVAVVDGLKKVSSDALFLFVKDSHNNSAKAEPPAVTISRWSSDSSVESAVDRSVFRILQQLSQYEPAVRLVRVIRRWKASASKRARELESLPAEVPAKAMKVLGASQEKQGRLRQ
jgi:hypothetical protein